MKKSALVAITLFTVVGICLTACSSTTVFRSVEADKAVKIASKKNVVVLDVRTPEEFAGGHLPDAINIDYLSTDFKEKLEGLDKKKKYLVYCRSGKRSKGAAELMKSLGFSNITEMKGGMLLWQGTVVY